MTTSRPSSGELYVLAADSFAEFGRTLSVTDWATPVPCTPGWTARDVLSHVVGVGDDILDGRTDGAATDPWTAVQVERNRDQTVADLLDRFTAQADRVGAALDAVGEIRPPFDCLSHEYDVRHALGRPGNRVNPVVVTAASGLAVALGGDVAVTVEFTDAQTITSSGGAVATATADDGVVLRAISQFEMFRSRLGRRTPEQVRSYDWSGRADAVATVIEQWFVFGPADAPVIE